MIIWRRHTQSLVEKEQIAPTETCPTNQVSSPQMVFDEYEHSHLGSGAYCVAGVVSAALCFRFRFVKEHVSALRARPRAHRMRAAAKSARVATRHAHRAHLK